VIHHQAMATALETLMNIANVAESAVPMLSLTAYIPQWRTLLRTRDSRSISMASWGIWAVSYLIATFYASMLLLVTGRGWPLVITTAVGLCFVLFTMLLIWWTRQSEGGRPGPSQPARD
jgi:uncharacterized protein with PQ loop repeat